MIWDLVLRDSGLDSTAVTGALKVDKDWTRWSEAFENQLNNLYGTMGVPLTYVIRELEIPDATTVYSTFVEECIAKAPLLGIKYESDTRQFHQLILSITKGQPSQEWIKPLMKKTNGQIDMAALIAHY